ncbi:MAG: nuclear transport factor 2 family protein [Lewinellaceae bacterium]|nr:nuclear transport factor 2 family protein [Lewinellaceae bacterium]
MEEMEEMEELEEMEEMEEVEEMEEMEEMEEKFRSVQFTVPFCLKHHPSISYKTHTIMKKLLFTLLILGSAIHLLDAQTPAQLADIKTFEQARYKAILANDLSTLETMVAPDLIYTHSIGVVENKAQYLEALANSTYKFSRFETDSTLYRMVNKNTAVATGILRVAGLVQGKPFDITARFSALYVRRKKHWMLHTWQTTKLR